MKYKEDQGRHARMAAFWTLTLLALFGSSFLFELLVPYGSLRAPIAGLRIPIVGVDVSPAFLIASIVFLVALVVILRWQKKPKVADLLIDTEDELKKVTWPTLDEVVNSSIVVIIFVVVLGAFLALTDVLLARILRVVLTGGAS